MPQMGDSINLAARLMCQDKANQNILCDDRTYNLSKRDFDFISMGTVVVKGKSDPIAIYQPLDMLTPALGAKHASKDGENKLIGRDVEKAKFIEVVDKMKKGEFGRLVVEGEGGQGISSLSRHLADLAIERDMLVW